MADMDKIDRSITEFLEADSRESFVDIGKKLKLSESAVRRRVRNLIDRGIIKKFTIELSDDSKSSALVLVSVDSATDTSKVSSKIARLSSIVRVYEITGQHDIAAILSAPAVSSINSGIDALRRVPGVSDTNTVMILKRVA